MSIDPVVSFVVLNWNGGSVVLDCLASIDAQRYRSIEVVVVDNGSEDGSLGGIRDRFPNARVVENTENLGFAGGMNRGFDVAEGDIIVAVNQDVVCARDFAERVVAVFAEDGRIGAVGGVIRQLTAEGPSPEFDAGGYWLRRRLAVGLLGPLSEGQQNVFGVSGCCPAFRRAMLEDLADTGHAAFDDEYFLYFEDIDLFFRAQLRGWRVVYDASVHAWHRRSLSSGGGRRFYQKPLWVQRLHFRNRYLTLIKDCPPALLPDLLLGVGAADLVLIPYLVLRSPRSLTALVLAWMDTVKSLPRAWRHRRRIQRARTGSGRALRKYVRGW